jgi:hypothetical protein
MPVRPLEFRDSSGAVRLAPPKASRTSSSAELYQLTNALLQASENGECEVVHTWLGFFLMFGPAASREGAA